MVIHQIMATLFFILAFSRAALSAAQVFKVSVSCLDYKADYDFSGGICMSIMGCHVSFEQAIAWKVLAAEENTVHCLAFSFVNWALLTNVSLQNFGSDLQNSCNLKTAYNSIQRCPPASEGSSTDTEYENGDVVVEKLSIATIKAKTDFESEVRSPTNALCFFLVVCGVIIMFAIVVIIYCYGYF